MTDPILERCAGVLDIKRGAKAPPFEKNWQRYVIRPMPAEEKLRRMSRGDRNHAYVLGNELAAFDAEKPEVRELLEKEFPELAESPSVKTNKDSHIYVVPSKKLGARRFYSPSGELALEYRTGEQYCMSPGSLHPAGTIYSWRRENPLQVVELEPIFDKLEAEGYTQALDKPLEKTVLPRQFTRREGNIFDEVRSRVTISQLIPLPRGNSWGRTRCPIHGSTASHPDPLAFNHELQVVKCWSKSGAGRARACPLFMGDEQHCADVFAIKAALMGLDPREGKARYQAALALAEEYNVPVKVHDGGAFLEVHIP